MQLLSLSFVARCAGLTLAMAAGSTPAATTLLFDPAQGITNQWLACGALQGGLCNITSTALDVPAGAAAVRVGLSSHSALLAVVPGLPPVNAQFPALDRSTGYQLGFDLQLRDERHASPHRAGFSITVIGHDLLGIEIGFQQALAGGQADARVFAQHDGSGGTALFTRGESSDAAQVLAALAERQRWLLDVQGDAYALRVASGGAVLLTGQLRNYTTSTGTGSNAYRTPSFLFVGDNTGSASAAWQLSQVAISTPITAPVPEPASAALMAGGLLAALVLRRRAGRQSICCASTLAFWR